MKISVVTPSIRPEMLKIVAKCLNRQTLGNWEWIIVCPDEVAEKLNPKKVIKLDQKTTVVTEPPKRKGDYYNLNKAWNVAFKQAEGKLIVSIVDGIWFEPDLLERLWFHYKNNPKAIIGAIGHQYERMENDKPEGIVWKDPRIDYSENNFYITDPYHIEWCIASIPGQAIKDIGGIDPEWDRFAAHSEKEANQRMSMLGYSFYIDKSIEYRAIKHERISNDWDEKYQEGINYFQKCLKELREGTRLPKLDYL